MGGGPSYVSPNDVRRAQQTAPRSSEGAFHYNDDVRQGRARGVHPELNLFGKIRECLNSEECPDTTPIVFVMDVTKSRGKDTQVIHGQLPTFYSTIILDSIVKDPEIMSMAVGDATCDAAPLQGGQFERSRRIDVDLGNILIEEGGGGTGEESYQLAAYFLARKTVLAANKRGKKGIVFFLVDERPYDKVSRAEVKRIIGDELAADIPTEQIFNELAQKYHVFIIFPRTTRAQRQASIDDEIKQRLDQAGGLYKDVAIRCSLIWHNEDDLDLHCVTPAGEEIYYGAKEDRTGGSLDVDRNAGAPYTNKPVENIRWRKGTARRGVYKFYVQNYNYHKGNSGETPFTVQLEVNGKTQYFEGVIPAGTTQRPSNQDVFEFRYDPDETVETVHQDDYDDDRIINDWARYVDRNRILRVEDASSSVEVMLGAMAIQYGRMTLAEFIETMKHRPNEVPAARIADAQAALEVFARQGVVPIVAPDLFGSAPADAQGVDGLFHPN